jgi:hypothetical protein
MGRREIGTGILEGKSIMKRTLLRASVNVRITLILILKNLDGRLRNSFMRMRIDTSGGL